MRRAGRRVEWLVVDAATGQTSPLFDADRMEDALAALPGTTRDRRGARDWTISTFNPSRTAALITIDDDLYFYDFSAGRRDPADIDGRSEERRRSARTAAPSPSCVPTTFTPSMSAAGRKTNDGSYLLNGKLDWLTRKRSTDEGDSVATGGAPTRRASHSSNSRNASVPEYTVADDIPYRQSVEVTDYLQGGRSQPL